MPTSLKRVEKILGHEFKNQALLRRALTHSSLADSRLTSNERLEFLGDAVLGMVVCEHLFDHYSDLLEGELTKIKSSVVSRKTCAEVAQEHGLDDLIRLGKGMSNRRTLPGSVAAAVYESVIGALYLDAGLEVTRDFILKDLEPRMRRAAQSGHQFNFKSVLQQSVQQLMALSPQYILLDEQGPDHAKCFEVCVEIGDRRFDSAWGPSKKQAEQQAALEALLALEIAHQGENGDIHLAETEAPTDDC